MSKLLFCDIRGHVEISVFEISRVNKKHGFCAVVDSRYLEVEGTL